MSSPDSSKFKQRGSGVVLTWGIFSVFFSALSLVSHYVALVAVSFGIGALILGLTKMKKIRAGIIDDTQRGRTQVGMVSGGLGIILGIIVLGVGISGNIKEWATDKAAHEQAAIEDFFIIARTGTPEQVRTEIAGGAKVNAASKDYGTTALMSAAEYNQNPAVITTLLEAGAKVNDKDGSGIAPLMFAAQYNPNPEVITTLLKAGAKPEDRLENGWTALMRAAAYNQNPAVITTLLEAGAKLDDRENSVTCFMVAAANNQNSEVITILLKAGAKLDDRDSAGYTPLMYAAMSNKNPKVITTLLKAGADAKAKDNLNGNTAFHYAQNNFSLQDTDALKQLEKASK
jgi:ankyrin repeat protein